MINLKQISKISIVLFAISSGAAFAQTPTPTPEPSPTPVPSPTPTEPVAQVYGIDCSFATGAKKAPVTCTVTGSVCIGADCETDAALVASCTDGFSLTDTGAMHTVNGTMLTVQGKDDANNTVAVDFANFDNKAGILESNLTTAAAGTSRAIAGSCTLSIAE